MRRISWTIALLLAGCGGSPDDASTTQTPASSLESPAVVTASISGSSSPSNEGTSAPARVVAQFYDALRDGDNSAIAGLLTDKAREQTAKNGLEILSQSNSSLTYELRETEYVTDQKDGAHVASFWTETDEHGQSATSEVIWVLRKQAAGWRIAGFAQVFSDDLPLLFDLEDPEHMLRTKEYVEKEFYGRQQESPMRTANPELPASADTRYR